jgi:hypothetical protein
MKKDGSITYGELTAECKKMIRFRLFRAESIARELLDEAASDDVVVPDYPGINRIYAESAKAGEVYTLWLSLTYCHTGIEQRKTDATVFSALLDEISAIARGCFDELCRLDAWKGGKPTPSALPGCDTRQMTFPALAA